MRLVVESGSNWAGGGFRFSLVSCVGADGGIRIHVQDFKLNKHKSNILQFLSLHAIAFPDG